MKKILKNNLGFSLIEIVVSVAILGVFISLVFGTIYYTNRASNNIKTSSNIQNDIKPIFNSIIDNIDSLGVNYNYYKRNGNHYNISTPMNGIALNNNVIYRKTSNCYSNFSCIEASFDNGSTYKKITFQNVNIDVFNIYFSEPSSNYMPIVSVVMSGYIQDVGMKSYDFSYQNTIEIKNYIK